MRWEDVVNSLKSIKYFKIFLTAIKHQKYFLPNSKSLLSIQICAQAIFNVFENTHSYELETLEFMSD